MDLSLILQVVFFIVISILGYVVLKNLDVIKIILKYWSDLLLRK